MLVEPLLEPMLPELELPLLLGELLLGELELLLGDDGLLLGELLLGELLDVPPLEELLPDLLKAASHSEREIEPSLFLSTDENDGVELLELAPPEALGEEDEEEELGEDVLGEELLGEDDELLEAPPEALPEDLLLSLALGLELDEPVLPVLWAAATPARARSAAAVADTTTFNIIWNPPREFGGRNCSREECNHHARAQAPCDFLHARHRPRPFVRRADCSAGVHPFIPLLRSSSCVQS